MDEESNSMTGPGKSLTTSRSDYKAVGEKRPSTTHLGENSELARKRVKMRDLESVMQSAETSTRSQGRFRDKEHNFPLPSSENDISQVTEVPVPLEHIASQVEKTGTNTRSVEVNPAVRSLDLNSKALCARIWSRDGSGERGKKPTKVSFPGKHDWEPHTTCVSSKGLDVDLNAEDVTSCINLGSAQSYKEHDQFKSKDVSESASCTGPLREKDHMRIWREMKRNGFLSSSHGGIPVPNKRGRKSKNDILKKNFELAKKEQVDRFSKIAAPSGLLNELNPGIINHVRNKKQVHSIIEAIVSEKNESANAGCKPAAQFSGVSTEVNKRDMEYVTESGKHQHSFHREEGTLHNSAGSRKAKRHPMAMDDSWTLEGKVGENDTCLEEHERFKSCGSFTHLAEDDILALKLSSAKASVSSSSLSNEESSNFPSVSSLSLKAATVASQWLELLHQDIKGRLSALRRSRRRVRAVINTELPYLMSKEFSNVQEKDSSVMNTTTGIPHSIIAEMHRTRWTSLFDQMDEALAEEEKQLESWLNQVKEKQLLCDQGLQHINWNAAYGLQQLGTAEKDSRVSSEKELAVSAAAASIYSTCSFLLSSES